MLTDRVRLGARLAGCRYLFLSLIFLTSGIPFQSLFPASASQAVGQRADAVANPGSPAANQVTAPPVEVCDLFPVASDIQLDSVLAESQYWSAVTTPSPRIIPDGLVLSYLCDSARHQCSGVQLI